jgi:tetratricopeptide (TPR) repeat protein
LKQIYTLLVLLFFAIVANAQVVNKGVSPIKKTDKDIGKSYGLIIGISNYSSLPKLTYADKDAEYFYQYLRQQTVAADSNNIALYLNNEATRDAVTDKLYEITDQVKSGDKVYLYFSGHGDIEQLVQTDNCLLLLSNSPSKNYLRKSNSYLDINLFKSFFQNWSAKQVKIIFVCDACHSGSLVGGEEGKKNTLLSLQQSWSNEIKLFSCQPDEVSLEGMQWGGGRGLFSYYFVLGLKGLADKNNNAEVSLFEMDAYLKEQVSNSSDQSQIPLVQGDLKWIISAVKPASLASARIEVLNNNSEMGSLALKNNGNGVIDLLKDSTSKILYKNFNEQLHKKYLLEPISKSALYFFNSLKASKANKLVVNDMKIQLIEALQSSFDLLLDYVYTDTYEKLGINEKATIEKELNTALDLAEGKKVLEDKIKSKLLFLSACEATIDIVPNSVSYSNREKMDIGITLLNKAISIDPISPHLYLKLGDYYLYTNRINDAIKTYITYQRLLPNDELSYNKLGLAYLSAKQYDAAIYSFKKAVAINSSYEQAAANLKIALKR